MSILWENVWAPELSDTTCPQQASRSEAQYRKNVMAVSCSCAIPSLFTPTQDEDVTVLVAPVTAPVQRSTSEFMLSKLLIPVRPSNRQSLNWLKLEWTSPLVASSSCSQKPCAFLLETRGIPGVQTRSGGGNGWWNFEDCVVCILWHWRKRLAGMFQLSVTSRNWWLRLLWMPVPVP